MGLFGGIGKFLGGVVKGGLSVATHGLSDKVLSVAKSLGKAKRIKRMKTTADLAMAARLMPRARSTERDTVSALDRALAGGGMMGTYDNRPEEGPGMPEDERPRRRRKKMRRQPIDTPSGSEGSQRGGLK